jgi:hypothetical protein
MLPQPRRKVNACIQALKEVTEVCIIHQEDMKASELLHIVCFQSVIFLHGTCMAFSSRKLILVWKIYIHLELFSELGV